MEFQKNHENGIPKKKEIPKKSEKKMRGRIHV